MLHFSIVFIDPPPNPVLETLTMGFATLDTTISLSVYGRSEKTMACMLREYEHKKKQETYSAALEGRTLQEEQNACTAWSRYCIVLFIMFI